MADVGEAQLSEEQLLAATSAPDAEAARAIDLRGLQLTSVEPLAQCRSLELALLSSNLLTAVHDSVLACSRLRKLDLSGNGISTLPKREDWTRSGMDTAGFYAKHLLWNKSSLTALGT